MWIAPPARVGPAMQAAHAMFGVGAVVSPVLVDWLSVDADGDGVFDPVSRWPAVLYADAIALLVFAGACRLGP